MRFMVIMMFYEDVPPSKHVQLLAFSFGRLAIRKCRILFYESMSLANSG